MKKAKPHLYIIILLCLISKLSFAGVEEGEYVGLTFVLKPNQYPAQIRKYNASEVYLAYWGDSNFKTFKKNFKKDTIINLEVLIDFLKPSDFGYRLIYKNTSGIADSLWQFDAQFRITYKAYNADSNLLKIIAYDTTTKAIDKFIFNYRAKWRSDTTFTLAKLLHFGILFNSQDRNQYAVSSVWMLSIGIDFYRGGFYPNEGKPDASSYLSFFKTQYEKQYGKGSMFHGYLLINKDATKDSILNVLKEIATKAYSNDYFIFSFSGLSAFYNGATVFVPFKQQNQIGLDGFGSQDTSNENVISLKTFQEYLQLISANNQLFISEDGYNENFKTVFIKTLTQNSSAVASILNKNRVIIGPNSRERDVINYSCQLNRKNPVNYYITSLDTAYNIYDIFGEDDLANRTAFVLKAKSYSCTRIEYIDVFFEKQFLQQYNDVFGNEETRGVTVASEKLNEAAGLSGKRYALVVGADNYKATCWKKLNNPIYDATEVADELKLDYGFEVKLLKDPPMDTIYNSISEYYKTLQQNDQLLIYFAGHGDFDEALLDDGFIVCSDSKSIELDPMRNTYIQHSKLKRMINKIPAKETLVVLDICHGGSFDEDILGAKGRDNTSNVNLNMNVLQYLKDKAPYKTRRVLSSVGIESAFDGKAGRHSPFANLMLQVLRAKGKGSNGIVTLSNIYDVLQTASFNENAALKISPHMARFGMDDPLGEFVLIPVNESSKPE
jgi:hypothetical protein